MISIRHRITYTGILNILQTGGDVANHSGGQLIAGDELACSEGSHLHHLCPGSGSHHEHVGSLPDAPLHDSGKDDHTLVGVIDTVKYQSLKRVIGAPFRSRNLADNLL